MIDSVLKKYDIKKDKPIITQISRFDRLKDPIGVIEAYLQVKTYIDCQLVLAGGTAEDDPFTRHLRDYMLLFLSLYHPEDIVHLC